MIDSLASLSKGVNYKMRKRTKEFYEKMNKVMEKLGRTNLSKWEGKYSWVLFRQSFGYGEYKVKITGFKMADLTGISESHIYDTEKRLKKRNIIQVNGKIKGFNLNTDEWENLPLPGGFKNLPLPGGKTSRYQEEKPPATRRVVIKKEKNSSRRENFYIKLSRTEIEKLELENWYQAVMWNYGNFSKEYIEKTIKEYNYNTRMSCWYIYQDSGNVRNKEAYFSKLLENYQEEKDETKKGEF